MLDRFAGVVGEYVSGTKIAIQSSHTFDAVEWQPCFLEPLVGISIAGVPELGPVHKCTEIVKFAALVLTETSSDSPAFTDYGEQ